MEYFEYRGVDNLVYAEVTEDSTANYTTGEVKILSPVAEIAKTTEVNSETKYYDNKPLLVNYAEGVDTLTITCIPLELKILAEITGKQFDEATGTMINGIRENNKYFAIGYRTKGTDHKHRYVWRYKGSFSIPDETFATETAGIETNNMTLTYNGIMPTHVFTKGGSVRDITVDERYDKVDVSKFFEEVVTPDTLTAKTTTT